MTTAQHDRLARQHERGLLTVLESYRGGCLSARAPDSWSGLDGQVAEALNQILDRANDTRGELERLAWLDSEEGMATDRELGVTLGAVVVSPGKQQQAAVRPPPWWLEWRVKHLCRQLDRRDGETFRRCAPAHQTVDRLAVFGPADS
jgi:hypothetical protein